MLGNIERLTEPSSFSALVTRYGYGIRRLARRLGTLSRVTRNGSPRSRGSRYTCACPTPVEFRCSVVNVKARFHRNPSGPRLASSSKDGTVRVWSTLVRRCEYALGGHTASVNVVRWGGGGLNSKGVLYTASSDRTVRVWDANGVRIDFVMSSPLSTTPRSYS